MVRRDDDARTLLDRFNADPDIAFIEPDDSPRKWIARRDVQVVADRVYCLWHVPSGPLPLVHPGDVPDGEIADPFSGWTDLLAGASPSQPFFGPAAVGEIRWTVLVCGPYGRIGISGFEWVGNYYTVAGQRAHPATERWWKQLRAAIKKLGAVQIPRMGSLDGPKPEIWALPSALEKIRGGAARANNPSREPQRLASATTGISRTRRSRNPRYARGHLIGGGRQMRVDRAALRDRADFAQQERVRGVEARGVRADRDRAREHIRVVRGARRHRVGRGCGGQTVVVPALTRRLSLARAAVRAELARALGRTEARGQRLR